jgi:2-octaprenyl-6-methoxyphenol hydroxylase
MRKADILICGGGMVGLPLGIAAAQGGLSVVVVDTLAPGQVLEAGFDGRVSALAYASVRMLKALGVWPHLESRAQPIAEILVTDGQANGPASPFSLHFDAAEVGAPSLGHIAENRHIRAALYAALPANLTLIAPATVTRLETIGGHVTVHLSTGEMIEAAVVAAADGRDSKLRAQQGIGVIGWSYPQTGIVATVAHERPHNGVAYEHFLPSGPFAILPMTENRSSLVWTEKAGKAPAMLAMNEADFNAEVARRFGPHLGATKVIGGRWSYPLNFHLARDFVRSGDRRDHFQGQDRSDRRRKNFRHAA